MKLSMPTQHFCDIFALKLNNIALFSSIREKLHSNYQKICFPSLLTFGLINAIALSCYNDQHESYVKKRLETDAKCRFNGPDTIINLYFTANPKFLIFFPL